MSMIKSIFLVPFFCWFCGAWAMLDIEDFLKDPVKDPEICECLREPECNEQKDGHKKIVVVQKPVITKLELDYFDKFQKDHQPQIFDEGELIKYEKFYLLQVFKDFSVVKEHGMRALFRYVPKNYNAKYKPQLLLIVHGTNGRETPGYYQLSDEQFQNFLHNAAKLADTKEAIVDIYSYEWSGVNSDKARINAGRFLGRILNGMQHYYDVMHAWPHSHGLGPVLVAANNLITQESKLICYAMGSPILEGHHIEYAPHVHELLNFTSEDDSVQWLGYWWSTSYDNSCKDWGICKKNDNDPLNKGKLYTTACHGCIANVHYTYGNYAPGHRELPKYLAKNLLQIAQAIEKDFRFERIVLNLAVNVIPIDDGKAEKISIMLYPLTQDEEDYYAKELPTSMLLLSEQNKKEHQKLYGYPKKLEFQQNSWDMLCAYSRRCYKVFK